METVIHNSDRTAAIVKGVTASAIVTFTRPNRATTPTEQNITAGKMAYWGDDNDFPQKVIADLKKDTDLAPLLSKQALLLYSGGLTWGIPDNTTGEEVLTPLNDADHKMIATWMRRSAINRYLFEASKDLHIFYNAFPELVLQMDRKQIIQLCAQPAEYCRWEKMNDKGIVENCYINLNFPQYNETHPLTKKVPVLDPYFDPAATLKAKTSGFNFIYPLSFPTPGQTYYQIADWNGIRESGWLAVSQAIPKFKLNLLEKQLNIKYHVEISDQYWPIRFAGFNDMKQSEQQKLVDGEMKKFSEVMSGVEGAGNSLITAMKTDFQMQKEYSMWKISPIDNKLAKGEFMEEVKEAAVIKQSAIGLHPALVGTMANSGMGGAGSNIREAYNLHNIMSRPQQDILLEPLYVVRDYNGWPSDMEFRIKNPFMATLNTGADLTNTKPVA